MFWVIVPRWKKTRNRPSRILRFANELGLALLANRKYNEVIELLKPISIREMENNTDVWRANLHMSVAYYYLQDKQKSKQHLEKALTMNNQLIKYIELMKKLQRDKEFGSIYFEAINSFGLL